MTAIDIDNQSVLWSEKASSLNSPAADNQAVYVANTNGHVVAYDLYNGQKLWENTELAYRQLSNPVVLGQSLVRAYYTCSILVLVKLQGVQKHRVMCVLCV